MDLIDDASEDVVQSEGGLVKIRRRRKRETLVIVLFKFHFRRDMVSVKSVRDFLCRLLYLFAP